MATITLKGTPITTEGELPKKGDAAPDFVLTRADLKDVSLKDFAGKKKILNIVVIIVVILWLLRVFGIISGGPGIRLAD